MTAVLDPTQEQVSRSQAIKKIGEADDVVGTTMADGGLVRL
jgi:hypothetical protein